MFGVARGGGRIAGDYTMADHWTGLPTGLFHVTRHVFALRGVSCKLTPNTCLASVKDDKGSIISQVLRQGRPRHGIPCMTTFT